MREEGVEAERAAAVRAAEAILRGEVGVIEGARHMLAFRFSTGVDPMGEDFLPFVAIDSETDHLPLAEVRRHWNPAALAEKDRETARAEAFHRDAAFAACRALIRRFAGDRPSRPVSCRRPGPAS